MQVGSEVDEERDDEHCDTDQRKKESLPAVVFIDCSSSQGDSGNTDKKGYEDSHDLWHGVRRIAGHSDLCRDSIRQEEVCSRSQSQVDGQQQDQEGLIEFFHRNHLFQFF